MTVHLAYCGNWHKISLRFSTRLNVGFMETYNDMSTTVCHALDDGFDEIIHLFVPQLIAPLNAAINDKSSLMNTGLDHAAHRSRETTPPKGTSALNNVVFELQCHHA